MIRREVWLTEHHVEVELYIGKGKIFENLSVGFTHINQLISGGYTVEEISGGPDRIIVNLARRTRKEQENNE